jgi:xylulokinase
MIPSLRIRAHGGTVTNYVLGIDLGTSSLKAVLLGADGDVAASATRGYQIQSPQPGWAEQDAAHWWAACCEAVRAVLAAPGIDGDGVTAICVGGQMHGTVLLDANGRLLRPAIIWPDGRAVAEAARAEAALVAANLLPVLGGGVSPGFMPATLLWCRSHEPDLWRCVATALLPKDYLRYRLTGILAGEPSDGSGIPAIDLRSGRWSADALAVLDLPPDLMPPLFDSAEPAGTVHASAAEACGLRSGTPVLAGGSDQAMAAIGAGLLHPGSLLISISTGGQIVAPIAAPLPAPDHGLRTICHALPASSVTAEEESVSTTTGQRHGVGDPRTPLEPNGVFTGGYLALSATLGAGLSVRWLRETLYKDAIDGDTRLLADATDAPPGAGGLLFLPYLAGERAPILDPLASGALIGMRLEHGRPYLARAVLEGIACGLRHALEPLLAAGVQPDRVILAGGLARAPLMREILAAVLGRSVWPLAAAEQSALGAALLAAAHSGFWPSLDAACSAMVRYDPVIVPEPETIGRYQSQYERYRRLYPALRAAMHELRASD